MIEKTAETFWEKAAATRWGSYISEIEKRALLHAQALIQTPGRALEIGCEGGRWSKLLSDLGWHMVCVDIDRETLSVCQQKVPDAECVLASTKDETIPCDPDSLDLLLCIEVAPVIDSEWFLPEAAGKLRDGAIVVGVVQNKASLRGLIHKIKNKFFGGKSEFYKTSYQSWKARLLQAGFRPVYEEGFCWGPFSRASNSPLVPAFARLERLFMLHRLTILSPWVVLIARKVAAAAKFESATVDAPFIATTTAAGQAPDERALQTIKALAEKKNEQSPFLPDPIPPNPAGSGYE